MPVLCAAHGLLSALSSLCAYTLLMSWFKSSLSTSHSRNAVWYGKKHLDQKL